MEISTDFKMAQAGLSHRNPQQRRQ